MVDLIKTIARNLSVEKINRLFWPFQKKHTITYKFISSYVDFEFGFC
jgi:hypothetical protein